MGGDNVAVSMEESKMDDFFQEVANMTKDKGKDKDARSMDLRGSNHDKRHIRKKCQQTLFFSLAFCNSTKMKRNKSKWLETQMTNLNGDFLHPDIF